MAKRREWRDPHPGRTSEEEGRTPLALKQGQKKWEEDEKEGGVGPFSVETWQMKEDEGPPPWHQMWYKYDKCVVVVGANSRRSK